MKIMIADFGVQTDFHFVSKVGDGFVKMKMKMMMMMMMMMRMTLRLVMSEEGYGEGHEGLSGDLLRIYLRT